MSSNVSFKQYSLEKFCWIDNYQVEEEKIEFEICQILITKFIFMPATSIR